jgi:hypothetical protein
MKCNGKVRGVEYVVAEHVAPPVGRAAQTGAAQQCVDAGEHFGAAYRFRQTIIGTGVQCCDNLTFAR